MFRISDEGLTIPGSHLFNFFVERLERLELNFQRRVIEVTGEVAGEVR
jgi:hypothetical protein